MQIDENLGGSYLFKANILRLKALNLESFYKKAKKEATGRTMLMMQRISANSNIEPSISAQEYLSEDKFSDDTGSLQSFDVKNAKLKDIAIRSVRMML